MFWKSKSEREEERKSGYDKAIDRYITRSKSDAEIYNRDIEIAKKFIQACEDKKIDACYRCRYWFFKDIDSFPPKEIDVDEYVRDNELWFESTYSEDRLPHTLIPFGRLYFITEGECRAEPPKLPHKVGHYRTNGPFPMVEYNKSCARFKKRKKGG